MSARHLSSWSRPALQYTAEDARVALSRGDPASPLFFITCHAGNYAGAEPCMAESFLFFEGGPVATVGTSTFSHPLTNALTSLALIQSLDGGNKRLGQLWLDAQLRMVGMRDMMLEQFLSDVEGSLGGRIDIARLKRDQVMMYAILGDPATRMRLPGRLEATVSRTGAGWNWEAKQPEGATKLSVGVRPASLRFPSPAGQPDRNSANDLLGKANGCFQFTSLPSAGGNVQWKGTVNRQAAPAGSVLRLVATGPGLLRVAVLTLE